MSVSSGTRRLLAEVASFAVAVAILAVAVINSDRIRSTVGEIVAGAPLPQSATIDGRSAAIEPAPRASSSGDVELAASAHGHFFAEAEINGRTVEVMVDTGASVVALTWEDAERIGVFVRPSDFTSRVSTANGTARVAPLMLERVTIGDITVRNVRGFVSERGAMRTTLLGMTFLGRLSKVEMRPGKLVLHE